MSHQLMGSDRVGGGDNFPEVWAYVRYFTYACGHMISYWSRGMSIGSKTSQAALLRPHGRCPTVRSFLFGDWSQSGSDRIIDWHDIWDREFTVPEPEQRSRGLNHCARAHRTRKRTLQGRQKVDDSYRLTRTDILIAERILKSHDRNIAFQRSLPRG